MKTIYLVVFRYEAEPEDSARPLSAFTTRKKAQSYVDALNKLTASKGVINSIQEINLY